MLTLKVKITDNKKDGAKVELEVPKDLSKCTDCEKGVASAVANEIELALKNLEIKTQN